MSMENTQIDDTDRESVRILKESIELQRKKAVDYQNTNSSVRQGDYYPRGLESLYDIMNAKMLRIRSVLDAMEHDPEYQVNFESLEDSAKDLINYCSFFVAYSRGKIDGQREIKGKKK